MQTREHIFKNLHMNKYDLISLVMHSSVDYDNKYVFVQLACKTNFNNLKTLRVNTWGKVYFMNISHFWIHIHMEIVQLCCLYLSKVAQWHQTYVFPCKFLIITPYKNRDFFTAVWMTELWKQIRILDVMRHCVTLGYVYLPLSRTMSSNNFPAAHAKEKKKNNINKFLTHWLHRIGTFSSKYVLVWTLKLIVVL